MFRPHTDSVRQVRPARGRRGAILVVVLGLLTLFAILGVAFVYTGSAEADAARIFKEQENQTAVVAPDASAAVRQFLQSLIYPVGDSPADITNSLRGHELLRSMYGGRGTTNVPYNGVGTFHEDVRNYGIPAMLAAVYPAYFDRAHAINHTAMHIGTNNLPSNRPWPVVLDPEMVQAREVPDANTAALGPFQPTNRATVAKNAPYTYPDLKDLHLGTVCPQTGEVLVKSFHRDWLFNAQNPNPAYRLAPWNPNDPLDPNPMTAPGSTNTAMNTDWVTAEGRLKILRPRPVDQLLPSELPAGFNPLPTAPQLAAMPVAQQQQLYNVIVNAIQAGTILGYPQQNADTSFSGDHVNRPGPAELHKADSILLDANMGVIRLSDGRMAKPMVSVLVTDQNGKLNPSVHGNLQYQPPTPMGGPTPPPQHMSHHGLGSWEVNLERAIGQAEARSIVEDRRRAGPLHYDTRAGVSSLGRRYEGTPNRLANYAPINWRNDGLVTRPSLPGEFGVSQFHTSPTFAAPFEDNTTAGSPNHPSLFSPAEWGPSTAAAALKTYTPANLRRMTGQFVPPIGDYRNMTFPRTGALAEPTLPSNNYRLAASHTLIGHLTPKSTSLDRPGLMPNYLLANATNALQLSAGVAGTSIVPTNVAPTYPPLAGGTYPGAHPNTSQVGPGTPEADFGNQNNDVNWRNIRAALGPVDINRRLADYRDLTSLPNITTMGTTVVSTPQPISPLNVANAVAAQTDRHNLAKDIFGRLVLATGAQPLTSATLTAGSDTFNALRYLAQLAVNIVDYIDNDDVSTVFVWNPDNTNDLTPWATATNLGADVGNRTVFGVEKPRLVLNEIYSEITNHSKEGQPLQPTDGLTNANLEVRFWVEMLNPTTAPYSDTNGIFGDGGVSVFGDGVQPYQISVRRVAPVGDTTPTVLADHSNVRGDFPPAPTADAFTCTFALPVVNADPATYRVRPNGSATGANQYTPQGVPANGMIILGPPMGDHALDTHFNPSRTNAPWNSMVESNDSGAPSNKMLYTIPGTTTEANLGNSTYKRHVVQLRRLANPYLVGPSDTNPYITVDCVDHVPANDGVARLSGAATRTAKPGSPTGYDARNARFAVGKIQPYASFADVVAGAGTTPAAVPTITQYNAPTSRFSAVLQQSPGAPTTEQVKHTFGQHNGQTTTAPANTFATPPTLTDTIMVPYDWYVHFDRPLVNQLELLHLQGVKPHLVTQLTMQAPLAAIDAPRKGLGLAPFLTGTNGLFRSLDLLRVQDRTYGTPHGGKLHGKVNINTIMHKDVFRAVFDAQPQVNGLFTDDAVYNSAIAFAAENTRDDIWSRMIVSLTPSQTRRTATLSARKLADGTQAYVPIPGPTFHDIDPTNPPPSVTTLNLDRPYLPFGVGRFDAPAAGNPVFAFPVGSGLQDTLLRNNEVTNQPAIAVPGATHDYFRMEAARKVLNNFTTTSETFAVSFTITFHEVRMAGSTQLRDAFDRNLLGKEIYKDIPGDLRQQYFCVIDRANVATDLSGGGGVVQQPFFTTMEAPPATATVGGSSVSVISIAGVDLSGSGAGPFVVYADGRPVQLVTNTQSPPTGGALYTQSLAVGVGANAEGPFTFSQVVTTATPGVLQVTLASALTKPHAVGTSVSNAVVGTGTITTGGLPGTSPFPTGQSTTVPAAFGPPTAASSAQFSGMIPYFTRVR